MSHTHILSCPGCGKVQGKLEIHTDRAITDEERRVAWCLPCSREEAAKHPKKMLMNTPNKEAALKIAEDLKAKRLTIEDAFEKLASLFG